MSAFQVLGTFHPDMESTTSFKSVEYTPGCCYYVYCSDINGIVVIGEIVNSFHYV